MNMLCVSIRPESETELIQDFQEAKKLGDLVEVRVDGFEKIPFDALKKLLEYPSILSLGKKRDADLLEKLAALKPEYLDIPHDFGEFQEIRKKYPKVKLICSYHDYEETPSNLEEIVHELEKKKPDVIKLVTFAKSGLDGLKVLSLLKETKSKATFFCMGEKGAFTRVLLPLYGGLISYASLPGKPTASGQLTAVELSSTYNYNALTKKTKPYALIGDPVAQSLSHITHNVLFRKLGMDAVYVKIPIKLDEADAAISLMEKLGFQGLSVTYPLKRFFGDGPYNTVCMKGKKARFLNSDGQAMLDAIEEQVPVKGKRVIVLGAGATGQEIAREALTRGARLIISNRTEVKSYLLSKVFRCEHVGWNNLLSYLSLKPYDVLINATTLGMSKELPPVAEGNFRPTSLVADVVSSPSTPFLEMAQKRGCKIVSGREMWLRQAAYQFCFWKEGLVYDEVLSLLRGAV